MLNMLLGHKFLFGGAAIALLSLASGCSELEQVFTPVPSSPSPLAVPAVEPSTTTTPPAQPAVVDPAKTWQQAQQQASDAINLAQSAQSRDDWGLVATRWQRAIALLQRIPPGSPQYAQAQSQRAEYQRNLATARQRANVAAPEAVSYSQPSPATPAATPTPDAANAPVAANPAASPSNPPPSPEVALANHLNQVGARMYATYWCGYCRRQQEMFGPEAVQRLTIIECDPRGQNAQPQLCRQAGVSGFPTWEINGRQYPGMYPLERLAELSGYRGPRNFGG